MTSLTCFAARSYFGGFMLPASTPGVSTVVCTRCFCMLGHFRPALITELFDGTDHSVHRLHLHLFLHVRLRLPERRSTRHTQEVSSAGTETVSARSHCSRQRFRHPWAPAARLMAACGQCETQHRQCCTSVSLRTRTRALQGCRSLTSRDRRTAQAWQGCAPGLAGTSWPHARRQRWQHS